MAIIEQVNLEPHFQQRTLPCEAEAGDLLVLSPVAAGKPDDSQFGKASLWFCIKASIGERPAIWARIKFENVGSCEAPVADPPQNYPISPREG